MIVPKSGAADRTGANRDTSETGQTPLDPASLAARLKPFAVPQRKRSIGQLSLTAGAFVVAWLASWAALGIGYWLTLLLTLVAAGLVVRLFAIQHDCGHGSYFRSRRANDVVGMILGVMTLTPYHYWRWAHGVHHATSGNLDRRGVGDITTLTVREYRDLRPWRRLAYRLYRHPLVLFGIGPVYVFGLKHRVPFDLPLSYRGQWISVMFTNAAIATLALVMGMAVGFAEFAMVHLPIMVAASVAGVWMFFVQHQFDGAYWRRGKTWNVHQSAYEGSSYYDLPPLLGWVTANLGLHHVHHLCATVPNYRLRECMKALPELFEVPRLTLVQSVRCARLALWDEEREKLVGFCAKDI